MIREQDVNWQFWRKCYCALDRELLHLLELQPIVSGDQFSLRIILNSVSSDYSRITKEAIAMKVYKLESTKIDIPKEWERWTKLFYEDYFQGKDMGCANYKGMFFKR